MKSPSGPLVECENEADDAIALSNFNPPQTSQFIVHHENDGHPIRDSLLQVETIHTANSTSGVSSAVEDNGDSLQLLDTAKKRLGSKEDQDTHEHTGVQELLDTAKKKLSSGQDALLSTGAHLLTGENLDRPSQLPEDLEDDELATLDALIRGTMLYAAGPDKLMFVPISELDSIVTIAKIVQELERSGETSDSHQLAEQIWSPQILPNNKTTTRRKLFAILCHMGKAEEIRTFIEEDVSDYDLPFEFETSQTLRRSGETIELFAAWDIWNRENFAQLQGRFLAPYFKLSNDDMTKFRDYKLHRCIVLPFTESEIEDSPLDYSFVGGFSVVRRVRIHSAHHDYSLGPGSSEKVQFAVKRLQKTEEAEQSTKKAPNRETVAYKRLNRLRHPHIVRLLATYTHRDHLHMIFPWADGNLYQFWRTHFPDLLNLPRTHSLALWMIQQFAGLAGALQKIQSPNPELPSEDLRPEDLKKNHGRHGDIKPENILWFKNTSTTSQVDGLGNLVISDLGSTEFHGTVSEVVKLNAAGGFTETYKAPEFDIMKLASPESDLWSFGCVLLEFIVWYMFGWAGVEEFSKARTKDSLFVVRTDLFFNYIKDENAVEAKPAVRKQFKKLRDHSKTSDFILDLLDFIESRLLRMRSQKRASCDDIVAKFHAIQELCNDRNYCVQRKSKRVSRTETFLSEKIVLDLSSEMMKEYDKSVDPNLRINLSRSTTQISSRQATIMDGPSSDTLPGAPDNSPAHPERNKKILPEAFQQRSRSQEHPRLYKQIWQWICKLLC